MVDYFDCFCFIDCVTWFSVFAMLSFSSFDSFPDRRQVVYTVETLEFQKFSRNSEINSNIPQLFKTFFQNLALSFRIKVDKIKRFTVL